jgi:nickel-dependent lactate racemase
LNDEGILILVAKCPDGIGNRAFYDILSSKQDVFKTVKEKYTFGGHKALKIAELLQRAHIFAVTGLPPKMLEDIGINPFLDVQSAMDEAKRLKGADARVVLVNDAGVTVPTPNLQES